MQALFERWGFSHTGWSFVEGGRAGDHQVQTWVPALIDFVDELPEGVEALLPCVGTDALDGFDLVQNQEEALASGLLQNLEQPAQEGTRGEMVQLALDASAALDVGPNVGLSHEPPEQTFGCGGILGDPCRVAGAQDCGKLRVDGGHLGQAAFK